MINLLLLACKQLSEFEKGQNVAYNNYRLSFRDFAKKLNGHHLSIFCFSFFWFCFVFVLFVFLKKRGNYLKKLVAAREEPLNLKIEIFLGPQITATLQVKDVCGFCFNTVNNRNVVM